MTTTARPPAGPIDPAHITIEYKTNEDGWITAQVVEFPAAISQGANQHEAWVNVVDALHDLTHVPSASERIVAFVQRLLSDVADELNDLPGLADEVRGRLGHLIRQRERIG